jgi:hypothetical protein
MANGSLWAALLITGISALAQTPPAPVASVLRSGGSLEVSLEAGDYEIQPGKEDRVVVSLEGRHASRMQVHLEGTEGAARLRISSPRHTEARAIIKVPAVCDLVVRLSAGELRIGAIRGNKDLRNRAGNLEVSVPDTGEYGSVYASVTAGDLDASAFRTAKSGLFRSFSWQGQGQHSLRARLTAGDLILHP